MVRVRVGDAVAIHFVTQSNAIFRQRDVFTDQCHIAQVPGGPFEPRFQLGPGNIRPACAVAKEVMRLDGMSDHPLAGPESTRCGFVVVFIMAEQLPSRNALMRVGFFLEEPEDRCGRVRHQIAPQLVGVIAGGVVLCRGGAQQNAHRLHREGSDDDARRTESFPCAPLQIFHGFDVAWIGDRADDSRYAGVVLDVNARGERAGESCHQGVAEGTNWAARVAPAVVLATFTSLIGLTINRQRQWRGMTRGILETFGEHLGLREEW